MPSRGIQTRRATPGRIREVEDVSRVQMDGGVGGEEESLDPFGQAVSLGMEVLRSQVAEIRLPDPGTVPGCNRP